jgi:hypothetical protein
MVSILMFDAKIYGYDFWLWIKDTIYGLNMKIMFNVVVYVQILWVRFIFMLCG